MPFKDNLRKLVEQDGRPQDQIEAAANIASGYLTRLMSGERNPGIKIVRRLAHALGTTVHELEGDAQIDGGERMPRVQGLRPTLQQLPGYADAEVLAARADPSIPIEVLREVREVSFARPPEVSPQLIAGLARLLGDKVSAVEETDQIRQRISAKRSKPLRNSRAKD